ncbi:hypothetical protein DH2020_035070 [Rehmannia glutinosa]|uniref:Uncharacterized protein n=1 Tax=Rehmannia glutinosa TaxID=99300 RepID=A0ABR0V7H4_REHGL
MLDCKPVSTSFPQGLKLNSRDGIPYKDPEQYRRLVGRLFYLNFTRPDITYCVQQLSQYVNNPLHTHLEAATYVLRYLKGCPSQGLFYPAHSDFSLVAYSDADWASSGDTRRYLTGFYIFFGGGLVSRKTTKQHTVSRSSVEAEYSALGATVCELKWLSYIAVDLAVPISHHIPLYCDNQAALHIVVNPVFQERTKHLEIDCHLVRDQFKAGFISPHKVPSHSQLADLFTNALGVGLFGSLVSKLGLRDFLHVT